MNETTHRNRDAIDLQRLCISWHEQADPEQVDSFAEWLTEDRWLSWDVPLQRCHVVVLAEAKSGKTTELDEQARHLRERAESAFLTTVQQVGQRGRKTPCTAPCRQSVTGAIRISPRGSFSTPWMKLKRSDTARGSFA